MVASSDEDESSTVQDIKDLEFQVTQDLNQLQVNLTVMCVWVCAYSCMCVCVH